VLQQAEKAELASGSRRYLPEAGFNNPVFRGIAGNVSASRYDGATPSR